MLSGDRASINQLLYGNGQAAACLNSAGKPVCQRADIQIQRPAALQPAVVSQAVAANAQIVCRDAAEISKLPGVHAASLLADKPPVGEVSKRIADIDRQIVQPRSLTPVAPLPGVNRQRFALNAARVIKRRGRKRQRRFRQQYAALLIT